MSRPSHLLSERQHSMWREQAERGYPPDPVQVARKQYDLDAYWYVRDHFWAEVDDLGDWQGVKSLARLVTRGGGKTTGVNFLILYAAEYVLPYLDARPENRNVDIIGRSAKHLKQYNMKPMEQTISHYAPWLKTTNKDRWKNPQALERYKLKKRTWGKTEKELTNGISVRAYGWNQSTRGSHVYLKVLDDFVKPKQAHQGPQHYDELTGGILPTVMDGGLLLLCGTPIHNNDVWAYVEAEAQRWDFRKFPAYDMDGTYGYARKNQDEVSNGYLPPASVNHPEDWNCLNPALLGYEELQERRGDSRRAELTFQREYLLQRVSDFNLLVHPDDFEASLDPDIGYIHRLNPDEFNVPTAIGVDPTTLKRSNFCAWVGARMTSNQYRPLWREHMKIDTGETEERRKERFKESFKRLVSLWKRFRPQVVVIEGNGFQSSIEPIIGQEHKALENRIETVTLTRNKHFEEGWPKIRTVFETGLVDMPYGPTDAEQTRFEQGEITPLDFIAREVTDSFRYELNGVYYQNGDKIETESDRQYDQVAAFYMMLRGLEQVSGGPISEITGVTLDPTGGDRVKTPEFTDPERSLGGKARGYDDAVSRLRRAKNLE